MVHLFAFAIQPASLFPIGIQTGTSVCMDNEIYLVPLPVCLYVIHDLCLFFTIQSGTSVCQLKTSGTPVCIHLDVKDEKICIQAFYSNRIYYEKDAS